MTYTVCDTVCVCVRVRACVRARACVCYVVEVDFNNKITFYA